MIIPFLGYHRGRQRDGDVYVGERTGVGSDRMIGTIWLYFTHTPILTTDS